MMTKQQRTARREDTQEIAFAILLMLAYIAFVVVGVCYFAS